MATELIPGTVDLGAIIAAQRVARERPVPEHDPWWEEDLNAAPAADRERLAAERRRLAAAEQAVASADAAQKAARLALVEVRATGEPADAATTALSDADNEHYDAVAERDLQRDVVAKIEHNLVAAVRGGRGQALQAQLDQIRAEYDAQIPALTAAVAALDTIRGLIQAERELTDALALARRDVLRGVSGFKPANGRRYLQIPEEAGQVTLIQTIPGHGPVPVTDPGMTFRRTGAGQG